MKNLPLGLRRVVTQTSVKHLISCGYSLKMRLSELLVESLQLLSIFEFRTENS